MFVIILLQRWIALILIIATAGFECTVARNLSLVCSTLLLYNQNFFCSFRTHWLNICFGYKEGWGEGIYFKSGCSVDSFVNLFVFM